MQNTPSENSQDQTVFTPQVPSMSGSHSPLPGEAQVQPKNNQSLFYTQEDDLDLSIPLIDEQDDQADQSSPFVLPFQNSAAMPTIATMNAQGQQSIGTPPPVATSTGRKRWGSFQLLKFLLIGSVVLITVVGASLIVFAQSATSTNTTQVHNTHTPGAVGTSHVATSKPTQRPSAKIQTPVTQSSPRATDLPTHQGQGTQESGSLPTGNIPSTQLLNQIGWIQSGLTLGDAFEALRTGNTFTDREMSYDYRNIGTPTNHSGTLTGATFLLTPGGQVRFVHNDVRVINNVLYDKIHTKKIVQQVVNAQPALAQFQIIQVQGQQHKFAWINVAFELLQSQIDPTSGKRTENIQINPATGQPLLHNMIVILVRVSPQNQGANAPMGGTGWLVNTYALDTSTLPVIATDPSI